MMNEARAVAENCNSVAYEAQHVHNVYDQIASHFSSTRYKPWPLVERFLRALAPGSVGVDIGCGNGKYLMVNGNILILASDRQHQPHAAIVADSLSLPHPKAFFDFGISIAVVHHLSTRQRRVSAIAEMLGLLKPLVANGPSLTSGRSRLESRALIYVWALEQRSSRRGWDAGDDQDVMVPWVKKGKACLSHEGMCYSIVPTETSPNGADASKTFHRYYHLYRSGELEEDIIQAQGVVLESGYEKDNWWAIATPRGSRQ